MTEEEKKQHDTPPPSSEEEKKAAAARAKAEAAAAAKAKKEAEEAAKPAWERDPSPAEVSNAETDPLVERLRSEHGEAVLSATAAGDDLSLEVRKENIREVCTSLFEEHGYRLLVDICGVDYPDREDERFEVIYHVYSLEATRRVRLKVRVADGMEVASVCDVWRGADWCEREVFDMFGIRFADHPDMTRILMWEGFHGHPLRKDFPVEGVDTGAAIYPELYDESAGPIEGTGTGWKAPQPEEPASDEGGQEGEKS
jgi:NADH-quinone oxidoreductase subunit C